MKVCIEKDPSGAFTVYQENEQPGETNEAMPGETTAQESAEAQNKQPAPDLKSALLLAGKMLSQPAQDENSLFDQGMKSTMPNRNPGMGV